jgi:hypothetical protein
MGSSSSNTLNDQINNLTSNISSTSISSTDINQLTLNEINSVSNKCKVDTSALETQNVKGLTIVGNDNKVNISQMQTILQKTTALCSLTSTDAQKIRSGVISKLMTGLQQSNNTSLLTAMQNKMTSTAKQGFLAMPNSSQNNANTTENNDTFNATIDDVSQLLQNQISQTMTDQTLQECYVKASADASQQFGQILIKGSDNTVDLNQTQNITLTTLAKSILTSNISGNFANSVGSAMGADETLLNQLQAAFSGDTNATSSSTGTGIGHAFSEIINSLGSALGNILSAPFKAIALIIAALIGIVILIILIFKLFRHSDSNTNTNGNGTIDTTGDGSGDGAGDGSGDGAGDGSGDGVGDGSGDGVGDGSGNN